MNTQSDACRGFLINNRKKETIFKGKKGHCYLQTRKYLFYNIVEILEICE